MTKKEEAVIRRHERASTLAKVIFAVMRHRDAAKMWKTIRAMHEKAVASLVKHGEFP